MYWNIECRNTKSDGRLQIYDGKAKFLNFFKSRYSCAQVLLCVSGSIFIPITPTNQTMEVKMLKRTCIILAFITFPLDSGRKKYSGARPLRITRPALSQTQILKISDKQMDVDVNSSTDIAERAESNTVSFQRNADKNCISHEGWRQHP